MVNRQLNILNTKIKEMSLPNGFTRIENKYSHTSVLVCFSTRQNLYSAHSDEKKMFQHSALARDSFHLLEFA